MSHRTGTTGVMGKLRRPQAFHGPVPVTMLAAILIMVMAFAPSIASGTDSPDEGRPSTRAPPAGYRTLDDLVASYPLYITGPGPDYRVKRSLELPVSVPLYVSEGQTILFDDGTYLNLSAPALFEGSALSPVVLGPSSEGGRWGGLGLTEADPSERPVMKNITLERAVIGIRSAGSDLTIENARIGNCSRSGLEVSKVTNPTARVVVRGTTFGNCSYYGVQGSEVRDLLLDTVTTLFCGTGIRLYDTTSTAKDLFVLESGGIGISLVASELRGSGVRALSSSSGAVSTTYQLLVHSSDVDIEGGVLGRSKVCTMAISGSTLALEDMEIGPAFTDGVQSNDSTVSLRNVRIVSCRESAVHSEGSTVDVQGSEFNENGKGSGNFRYSTFFLRGTSSTIEASTIKGSGDAHIEATASLVRLANSTLSATARSALVLDDGARIDIVDTSVPGRVLFLDPLSLARTIDLFIVSVKDFSSGSPVPSATVDLLGPDMGYLGSYSTASDGTTDVISAVIRTNTSSGNTTGLPLHLAVTGPGYELTMVELTGPANVVNAELYPPNEPPELSLLRPLNGSQAGPQLVLEGYLTDDLGVLRLQIRLGSGPWTTRTVDTFGETGYFLLNVTYSGVSPGQQTVSVQAFDGVHTSEVLVRTVNWMGPSALDSDGDGLLDIEEDRNGNGLVDEGETDPEDPDSDGDGLMDGLELDDSDGNTTDPLDPDTDGDFLLDGVEDQNRNGRVDATETDPNDYDTDGDGASDKDDHYPLDPTRILPPDGDDGNDAMLILILVIVIVVLLGMTIYIVIVKVSGTGGRREEEGPRPPRRPGRPVPPQRTPRRARERAAGRDSRGRDVRTGPRRRAPPERRAAKGGRGG